MTRRWVALLALAWPLGIANAAQALGGFFDTLFVSPLGDDAIAATGTGALNTLTVALFPMGLVVIVQTFSAQLAGAGDRAGARRFGWYGLVTAAGCGALAIAAIPLLPYVLAWLGMSEHVTELMARYMGWRFAGFAAMLAVEALGAWYAGVGQTRIYMITTLIMVALDIGLKWLLITGHAGMPALGVAGAAIATVIAAHVGLAVMLICFIRDRPRSRVASERRWRWSEVGRMLVIGLPNSFVWFLDLGAVTVFVDVVVGHLGTEVLAATAIVININSLGFMPAFGIGMAGGTLVGQAVGARDHAEVNRQVRVAVAVAIAWTVLVAITYLIARAPLISLFSTSQTSASTVHLAGSLLWLGAVWQPLDAAQMVLSEAVRATGDTRWSMWAHGLLAWLVFLPAAAVAVFVLGGGYVLAYACLAGYFAIVAIAMWRRLASGAWRQLVLVTPDA